MHLTLLQSLSVSVYRDEVRWHQMRCNPLPCIVLWTQYIGWRCARPLWWPYWFSSLQHTGLIMTLLRGYAFIFTYWFQLHSLAVMWLTNWMSLCPSSLHVHRARLALCQLQHKVKEKKTLVTLFVSQREGRLLCWMSTWINIHTGLMRGEWAS